MITPFLKIQHLDDFDYLFRAFEQMGLGAERDYRLMRATYANDPSRVTAYAGSLSPNTPPHLSFIFTQYRTSYLGTNLNSPRQFIEYIKRRTQ